MSVNAVLNSSRESLAPPLLQTTLTRRFQKLSKNSEQNFRRKPRDSKTNRERENPGGDHLAANAPTDCGQPSRGAHAHDCSVDGMRGANGDAERAGQSDGQRGGRLGCEAVYRLQLG